MITQKARIVNKLGLHARPSAMLVSAAGKFKSQVFFTKNDLRVNGKKTRVQRNNMRQSVTGIVVNDKRSIDRRTIRRLRAILHNARRTNHRLLQNLQSAEF